MTPSTPPLIRDGFVFPSQEEAFRQLNTDGLLELRNIFSDDFIAACRAQVDAELEKRGARYFTIANVSEQPGSHLAEIRHSQPRMDFLSSLCNLTGLPKAEEPLLQGNNLRVIAGGDSISQAFNFHFDSSVLTMLLPIYILSGEDIKSGHLLAKPNFRPFGQNVVTNLIGKVIYQNKLVRWVLMRQFYAGKWARHIARLKPTSAYLFWGARTLHANLPCASDHKRATALFFFGRPNVNDPIMNWVEKRRYKQEANILENKG